MNPNVNIIFRVLADDVSFSQIPLCRSRGADRRLCSCCIGGAAGLIEKRKQVEELEKRNAALAREIEEKRARIGRLRDNETDQELEIRQRLKLVKPDEKVFMLQDQEKK